MTLDVYRGRKTTQQQQQQQQQTQDLRTNSQCFKATLKGKTAVEIRM